MHLRSVCRDETLRFGVFGRRKNCRKNSLVIGTYPEAKKRKIERADLPGSARSGGGEVGEYFGRLSHPWLLCASFPAVLPWRYSRTAELVRDPRG